MTWVSLNNHLANKPVPVVSLCEDATEKTNLMWYLGIRFHLSLGFRGYVCHIAAKARKGLAAVKIMAAGNFEWWPLVLLYQGLVL